MAKKKACKMCRMFVDGEECPNCKTSTFTNTWKGRLAIVNPEKSRIAGKIGIKNKGEYAIKVR
jgi:DNA-directed RNA polymerase subunit E"